MVGNLPWSSTGAFSLPRANLRAYPNYTSPIAAGPALSQLPSQCSVHLFSGVLLTAYGQIATAPFSTPTGACSAPWSSVVLSMHGSVRGVQFDRYGALWIGGVELLRTTTPEPSPAGIDWHIARDVTVYGSFLASGEPMNATLSIPNVVDSTYTGALSISVSLSFEPGRSLDDGLTTEAPADLVIPLANPAR
ncbi:hypothetical protein EMIHUDRAFT_437477, partial [Emiliania huxleyi CCMP1516]|uniref:Peptide N-acetyl-beta-D-glucosaminyl asparaginase amidase A N-terminal domain-containing protein n=2 Tax=Emiliania huxleyi TaxID=2903 RepID=A0A0D3IKN4_EMIH1